MTIYEYFEAWLTTKEWRTWKKHSVVRFSYRYSMTQSEARRERDEYLKRDHDFESMTRSQIYNMFESMIDDCFYWCDTPQGTDHWQSVVFRRRPIRRLNRERIVITHPLPF
jgi:hypothetical protein